jgi:ABC-2 type transport system permease protein
MIRLLRSEYRKVVTTKLWWGMLLGAIGFAAIAVIAQMATNGFGNTPAAPLNTPITQRAVFSSAAAGYFFSAVVGITLMTTEFRHLTSRPTFLLAPRRTPVIAAKLIVAAALGVFYGVTCVAVSLAIAVPWLSAKGVSIGWVANGVVQVLLGVVFVIAVFAVVGVGVGALLRSQVTAVIAALAYLLVVEPLAAVVPVIKDVYAFLPGAAGNAVVGVSRNPVSLLPRWAGALILFGWGLLFPFLAWLFTMRRDIP